MSVPASAVPPGMLEMEPSPQEPAPLARKIRPKGDAVVQSSARQVAAACLSLMERKEVNALSHHHETLPSLTLNSPIIVGSEVEGLHFWTQMAGRIRTKLAKSFNLQSHREHFQGNK